MTATDTAIQARADGRAVDELRAITFTPDFLRNADASVLVEMGNTRILCAASVEESVRRWMEGRGEGWVTAEYAMLPASTGQRKRRDGRKGQTDGRSVEIQRLIGRSLRAVVDRGALGARSITVDCDVIDADGGTRCASICGGWVVMAMAVNNLMERGAIETNPIRDIVSAVSVGVVDGVPVLDLPYVEDSRADTDMNLILTGAGQFVELQATAEGNTFSNDELARLIELGRIGCHELAQAQIAASGTDFTSSILS
jgi:ribonuclease PH